ncbi:MAG: trypsin-like serine protease [Halioglobus sp.]
MTSVTAPRHALAQAISHALLCFMGVMPVVTAAAAPPAPGGDSRLAYSSESPQWLRAVGRLQIPGQKFEQGRVSHHREDCSATLVARHPGTKADTIITAWHCLEFYNDVSQAITFTLSARSADPVITSEAYRLADGGGMHADWAILRLYQAIPSDQVSAVNIHPERADPSRPITMAGYSRDNGLGDNGERLTFDPQCRITHQANGGSNSNCTAYKGASGGAVMQLSHLGQAQFCGVISQGNGEGISTFVPLSGFRNAINLHLR